MCMTGLDSNLCLSTHHQFQINKIKFGKSGPQNGGYFSVDFVQLHHRIAKVRNTRKVFSLYQSDLSTGA